MRVIKSVEQSGSRIYMKIKHTADVILVAAKYVLPCSASLSPFSKSYLDSLLQMYNILTGNNPFVGRHYAPRSYAVASHSLRQWLARQRGLMRQGKLTTEQVHRLHLLNIEIVSAGSVGVGKP